MRLPRSRFLALIGILVLAPALGLEAGEACSAELKVGTGIEKAELKEDADSFSIDPGTRLYAWTRVKGLAGKKVTLAFEKGGREVFRHQLEVPRSPYRTNAYRTFRAGDEGEWTVKLMGDQDAVLGSATFKVTIQ